MKPIYYKDRIYTFLRPYVDYCCRSVYSKAIIRGEENLPKDGEIIIAPNHSNTLMDALVILRASSDATVFGARADIFRNPRIARLMHFLKILPMVRLRDGLHNVVQNYRTISDIIEVLEHNVRFCMFSEGTHRMRHSLLPIRKGIFRIAVTATDYVKDRHIYVVPTGIEYGDYTRYKSTCIITYGEPIDVTEFLSRHPEKDDQEKYRILTGTLHDRLSSLITYIPDDENYQAKWNLVRIASAGIEDPEEIMASNRNAASAIEDMLSEDTEKGMALLKESEAFERERKEKKISYKSLGYGNMGRRVAVKTINSILAFPFFLFFATISFPMWCTAEYLCSKLKDKAFSNTVRFGVKVAMSPIMIILWAVWYFSVLPVPPAILLLLLSLMSYSKFYEYRKYIRILASDYRYMRESGFQKKFRSLRDSIAFKK